MRWIPASLTCVLLAACATNADRAATPVAGAPSAAPSRPIYRLADIEGRTAAEINAVLGAPGLVRREGRSEFRRYDLAACAIIAIVMPDGEGAMRARTIEASALRNGEEKPDLAACLAKGPKQAATQADSEAAAESRGL